MISRISLYPALFRKLRFQMIDDNIVSDFAQIFRAAINDSPGFRSQQFAQCGLSSFDPARQNGFTADEGANESVRVGQPPAFASKSPDEAIRIRERADQSRRPIEHRRQWRRDERAVGALGDLLARNRFALAHWFHKR